MQFNTYLINAEGRNKYGDYRKPVRVGKITQDSDSCTYTLTNLQAQYSEGTAIKPDLSNYATLTGTFNTYVNGVLRQSETGVTVTPIGVENAYWVAEGETVVFNYDQFSATTTPTSTQGVRGIYNGVTSSSVANVTIAANTTSYTSSELLSFNVSPSSITSAATTMQASGLGRRTLTFTSGVEQQAVSMYIGTQQEGWLYVDEAASWLSVDASNIYAQQNDTANARSATVYLKDALFPNNYIAKTITQSEGSPSWQECHIVFTYGDVTAPQTGTWDQYTIFYSYDESEAPVEWGDPMVEFECGTIIYQGGHWNPIDAASWNIWLPFEEYEPYDQIYVPSSFAGQTIYLQAEFGSGEVSQAVTSAIVPVFIPLTGGTINVTMPQF